MSSPMDYVAMGLYNETNESPSKPEEKKKKCGCGPIMITPEWIRAARKQLGIEVYKSDGTLA